MSVATHYETTNAIWSRAGVKWHDRPLTQAEARRMAGVLWRLAGRDIRRAHVENVWLTDGVRRLVHDMSHWVWRWKRPYGDRRDHCFEHSTFEKTFSEEAIKRRWHVAPAPRRARPSKPAPDPVVVKRERLAAALKRWRTKAKRAATAIKKTERAMKRLDKKKGGTIAGTALHHEESLSGEG